ncbi:MAG: hypothetical protein ACE5IY_15065 [bacterium]
MLNDNSGLVKLILSILLFPTFFQEAFLWFAWGSEDPSWMMVSKRLFLLLPVGAIILGCWISVACLLTVIIRPNRQEYIKSVFLTWWDLGKSIASFWGGIFKFIFNLFAALVGLVKVALLALWSLVQELIFMPFRLLANVGRNIATSPIPWIAVILTLFWCLIEAVIFTYVTTPLVVDTFSNITGDNLTENMIRIPLFIFLLFIVLGSYAVLSTFVDAVNKKSVAAIAGIGVVEIIVLLVEVVFLYREFVDALVPWFAQYSENFELGVFWTLAISTFVWFGIRSLSWFLFASHGTPTIMTVIQGRGLALADKRSQPLIVYKPVSADFMAKIKQDMAWVQRTGDDLLGSFALPPLQVVAAAINFCMLLISGQHLFRLPFVSMADLRAATETNTTSVFKKDPSSVDTALQVRHVTPEDDYNHTNPNFGELHNVETR